MPVFPSKEEKGDCYFLSVEDNEQMPEILTTLVRTRLPKACGVNPIKDIPILCPMNRGSAGARTLNEVLQLALNPPTEASVLKFGTKFGIHLGADHVVKAGNDASWLFGGAFHYGQSDMDGTADAAGGSADVDQYTFKAYATYMKDNGAFVDLVLHAGYYDTELTGLANNKIAGFKADYSNWGYGISAEAGHRFEFGETASAWYVEPTAQLTWFHAEGKDFTTSTGLAVSQGDADFITGRLGAAMGKTFALGTDSDPLASYFSVGLKGGMLYQFDGDQTITAHGTDGATVHCDAMDLKGARAYYGLTADWKIDDAWRVYGQISREEGSGYTKDYDASIGVRYAF